MKLLKRNTLNKNLIDKIAESKRRFHKKRAEMSFEDKVKIIIELQKIDAEIRKRNPRQQKTNIHRVWQLQN
jgi:hypothetical protein